jgi:hypothetical protein
MRFSRRGDYEVVTRISGPLHHYLGLRLVRDRDNSGAASLIVEDLSPAVEGDRHGEMPGREDLTSEVLAALDAANARLGTHYGVVGIHYCSSDPDRKNVYRELAEKLIEHVDLRDRAVAAPVYRDETSVKPQS